MTATTDRFQKDNIDAWNADPDSFWPFDKNVWSERRGEVLQYSEIEFFPVWKDIHAVWKHPIWKNALRLGCGRETLAYTVRQVTGNWYPATYLRYCLEIGVALEWAIPNQGRTNHTCFLLRPIRYEERCDPVL